MKEVGVIRSERGIKSDFIKFLNLLLFRFVSLVVVSFLRFDGIQFRILLKILQTQRLFCVHFAVKKMLVSGRLKLG